MKHYWIILSLIAALTLTGCQAGAVEQRMDTAKDAIESRVDAAADTIESQVDAVEDRIEQAVTPTSTTAPPVKLTAEEAEAIALKDAGLTREQASRLYTEYDVDHGIPEYDVEFHAGGWEYDYEIHAETGEILFKDIERDD